MLDGIKQEIDAITESILTGKPYPYEWSVPNRENDQWVDLSKEAIETGDTVVMATISGEINEYSVIYVDDLEASRFAVVKRFGGGGFGKRTGPTWSFGAWYPTYREAVGVAYREAMLTLS